MIRINNTKLICQGLRNAVVLESACHHFSYFQFILVGSECFQQALYFVKVIFNLVFLNFFNFCSS